MHILENVRETGAYLQEKLDELVKDYDMITERRGIGLMQGIVFDRPVAEYINKALERGLMLINAGTNIIRIIPSLIVTKEQVDDMIAILRACLANE